MATDTIQRRSWVQKTPNVCGGDACIRDTRITVNGLVEWRRLGLSDDRIMEIIQDLTPEDLEAAWEFHRLNPVEIDEEIRLNNEA